MSLSVVAIHPPSAVFREEQRFGWWVYSALAVIVGLVWFMLLAPGPVGPMRPMRPMLPFPEWFATAFVLSVLLFVAGVLRMTTLVTPAEVRVWFGWIPTRRRSIAIGAIARVEVVRYRPIADCGGWGIRSGPDGERVLNARGDRGVRLHFADGSRILIGSQRPEELALAVEGALRPGIS